MRNCDGSSHEKDAYYGMTLVDDDEHVPGWKKSQEFIRQNPALQIVRGADDTGDVLAVDNLASNFLHHRNSVDLVTGDGGFDFSSDFLNQESTAAELVFAQVAHGVLIQKMGGNMVIKLFDAFTRPTVEVIYFLTGLYAKVYIIKPNTSRYANSERYLICKGFLLEDSSPLLPFLSDSFRRISAARGEKMVGIFDTEVPHHFLSRLEEYNAIIGQQQIETICATLQLVTAPYSQRGDKIDQLKRSNIIRCVQWCTKHRLAFHRTSGSASGFGTRAQNT
jgi:hypothetical protein